MNFGYDRVGGPYRVVAMLLVLSLAGLAHAQDKGPGAAEGTRGKGRTFRAKPLPDGYFERTSLLWGVEDVYRTEPGGVFFNLTGGNLPGQEPEPYNYWPTLLVRIPEGWRVVDLREDFLSYEWSHVAAAPGKGYYWGFLEYTVEGPGWEIPIILSMDGGRTWSHAASIKKPDFEAMFHSFEMDTKGRGRLRVTSDKDCAPGTRKIFTYVTSDWGRTWRRSPSVEISALKEGVPPTPSLPCGLAAQRLPTPLPEECKLPEYVRQAASP
jgi:hypothetical protein